MHGSVISHVPSLFSFPRRSSETPSNSAWCAFYAAPWWCGWEEAGWLWMSSWWRTTPVEVSSKVHHRKSQWGAAWKTLTQTFTFVVTLLLKAPKGTRGLAFKGEYRDNSIIHRLFQFGSLIHVLSLPEAEVSINLILTAQFLIFLLHLSMELFLMNNVIIIKNILWIF